MPSQIKKGKIKHRDRERPAKSLSPKDVTRIKKRKQSFSPSAVSELEHDGSNRTNLSPKQIKIMKQLESNFNKKYISDDVTIDSKLRRSRNLQTTPNKLITDITSESDVSKNFDKNSLIEQENLGKILSLSFETPPSSDESSSPKLSSRVVAIDLNSFPQETTPEVNTNYTSNRRQSIIKKKIVNIKNKDSPINCGKSIAHPTSIEKIDINKESTTSLIVQTLSQSTDNENSFCLKTATIRNMKKATIINEHNINHLVLNKLTEGNEKDETKILSSSNISSTPKKSSKIFCATTDKSELTIDCHKLNTKIDTTSQNIKSIVSPSKTNNKIVEENGSQSKLSLSKNNLKAKKRQLVINESSKIGHKDNRVLLSPAIEKMNIKEQDKTLNETCTSNKCKIKKFKIKLSLSKDFKLENQKIIDKKHQINSNSKSICMQEKYALSFKKIKSKMRKILIRNKTDPDVTSKKLLDKIQSKESNTNFSSETSSPQKENKSILATNNLENISKPVEKSSSKVVKNLIDGESKTELISHSLDNIDLINTNEESMGNKNSISDKITKEKDLTTISLNLSNLIPTENDTDEPLINTNNSNSSIIPRLNNESNLNNSASDKNKIILNITESTLTNVCLLNESNVNSSLETINLSDKDPLSIEDQNKTNDNLTLMLDLNIPNQEVIETMKNSDDSLKLYPSSGECNEIINIFTESVSKDLNDMINFEVKTSTPNNLSPIKQNRQSSKNTVDSKAKKEVKTYETLETNFYSHTINQNNGLYNFDLTYENILETESENDVKSEIHICGSEYTPSPFSAFSETQCENKASDKNFESTDIEINFSNTKNRTEDIVKSSFQQIDFELESQTSTNNDSESKKSTELTVNQNEHSEIDNLNSYFAKPLSENYNSVNCNSEVNSNELNIAKQNTNNLKFSDKNIQTFAYITNALTDDSKLIDPSKTSVKHVEQNTILNSLGSSCKQNKSYGNKIDLQCLSESLLRNNFNELRYSFANHTNSLIKSPLSTDSAQGSSIDVETNFHPKHCEIFWGRKNSFPYWPCLIWPDPEGKTIKVEKNIHAAQFISYHVKFFADNGQRSWIKKDCLMAYNGREDFERKAKEQSQKLNKQTFKKYFTITKAKLPVWEQAIREADLVLSEHIEKRQLKFDTLLKESLELKKIEKEQKRRLSTNTLSLSRQSNGSTSITDVMNNSIVGSTISNITKRKRSSSINENFAKRHKGETELITQPHLNYAYPRNLIDLLTDYCLINSENEETVKALESVTNEIFKMRSISVNEEGSHLKRGPNRVLRRGIANNIQKNYQSIFSKPTVIPEKVIKKKNEVPSIDIVLKDIIDLYMDKNYLFRHLKKDPVCKICLKPNDLVKCSGYCRLWIHHNCQHWTSEEYEKRLEESSKIKRKSKKLEPSESQSLVGDIDFDNYQRKSTDLFTHITGDDDDENQMSSNLSSQVEETIDTVNSSLISLSEKVTCKDCQIKNSHYCLICKKSDAELVPNLNTSGENNNTHAYIPAIKCKIFSCGKFYHLACLNFWPQTHITKSIENSKEKIEIVCPSHTCHTCVSDDPHNKHFQLLKKDIIKCTKCPASYHCNSNCIPAGSEFITGNMIICPRHRIEDIKPINTDWCFICSGSGNLICCDSCPSSFHLQCLKLNQEPQDKYLCELCENGCLPVYGELVWCKYSRFKWWPSVIIPPPIVPKNITNQKHPKFEFCVRFLGTKAYGWSNRHRVFLYQEDDYTSDDKSDRELTKAIEEAKITWEFLENKRPTRQNIENDKSIPRPYKKIKSNCPVPPVKLEIDISELNACNCSPESSTPCGVDTQCLNRVLMVECTPTVCPAKEKCQNQMFEKRQYAPISVSKTSAKGFGLISTAPILSGTFIIEYVGELIDDIELKRRITEKQNEMDHHYYFFSIESGLTIDAGPKGNLARFMNHSCEPNCEPQMWTVHGIKRIGLFAREDIKENTELTFHYNFECAGENKIVCHCGAEKCTGFIGGIYKQKSVDQKSSLPILKSNNSKLAKNKKKNSK